MTLEAFLTRYDIAGSVVLLEGKRTVAEKDQPLLEGIAAKLTRLSSYILFRSGDAPGADFFFSQGVAGVDPQRLEKIQPYAAHRTAAALSSRHFPTDDIDGSDGASRQSFSRLHGNNAGISDWQRSSKGSSLAAKARYILRDTLKITGAGDLVQKASFAIFYDDHENPESGETGHTMLVCRKCGIPFIDQTVWMKWLEE